MSRPLTNLADFTPQTFIAAVDRLLADPGAVLATDVDDLLSLSDISQLNHRIDKHFERYEADNGAYASDYLGKVLAGANPLVLVATIGAHLYKKSSYRGKRHPVVAVINAFEVRRPVLSLTDQERGLLRGAAELTAERRYSSAQWRRHLALMTWNDGNANLQPTADQAKASQILEAKERNQPKSDLGDK